MLLRSVIMPRLIALTFHSVSMFAASSQDTPAAANAHRPEGRFSILLEWAGNRLCSLFDV